MNPPCKDCGDRTLGCHDGCARYAEFKAWREEIREQRRRAWRYPLSPGLLRNLKRREIRMKRNEE